MSNRVLGPVFMRRSLQEVPEVKGRFLLDFRPEYHLGDQGLEGGSKLHPPAVLDTIFRLDWESQGRRVFREELDSAAAGTEGDIHEALGGALFPSRALVLKIIGSPLGDSDLIDEMTQLFGEQLRGMFGAMAYRSAASGARSMLIGRQNIFTAPVQREILRRIPFDIYKASEILDDLYKELLIVLRIAGLEGSWGRVTNRDGAVCLEVNPALPEFSEHNAEEDLSVFGLETKEA